MSPHHRAQFLKRLAPELGALQREFGLAAFPPAERGSEWAPYPGLSDARREQLRREHGRISARPAVRIERMRIRSSSALRRTPAGRKLLAAGRLLAR
jgi:hypothetical protein